VTVRQDRRDWKLLTCRRSQHIGAGGFANHSAILIRKSRRIGRLPVGAGFFREVLQGLDSDTLPRPMERFAASTDA
jgi:hypothetical protein